MKRNHFTALVIGDEPEKTIAFYGPRECEKKLFLKRSDLDFYRKQYKEAYANVINAAKATLEEGDPMLDKIINLYTGKLMIAESGSDDNFWADVTKDYDIDPETGDAYTPEYEPEYEEAHLAKLFAVPFLLKDGSESFSALKDEIDWDRTEEDNVDSYRVAWDTVVENKKPRNRSEQTIYNAMKNKLSYLLSFETKENYVASCTKFWCYSVVSDDGWSDLDRDGDGDQFKWVLEFRKRFIDGLPGDTRLTIYEYTKGY